MHKWQYASSGNEIPKFPLDPVMMKMMKMRKLGVSGNGSVDIAIFVCIYLPISDIIKGNIFYWE